MLSTRELARLIKLKDINLEMLRTESTIHWRIHRCRSHLQAPLPAALPKLQYVPLTRIQTGKPMPKLDFEVLRRH